MHVERTRGRSNVSALGASQPKLSVVVRAGARKTLDLQSTPALMVTNLKVSRALKSYEAV